MPTPEANRPGPYRLHTGDDLGGSYRFEQSSLSGVISGCAGLWKLPPYSVKGRVALAIRDALANKAKCNVSLRDVILDISIGLTVLIWLNLDMPTCNPSSKVSFFS